MDNCYAGCLFVCNAIYHFACFLREMSINESDNLKFRSSKKRRCRFKPENFINNHIYR